MAKTTRTIRRAFTIIEVIVIVVILGVLAAVIAPRFLSRIGQSRTAVAKSNAAALASAMKSYMLDCGTPESGASIDILWERPGNVEEGKWKGPYVDNQDALNDPWGRDFILRIPPEFNADFDIVSYGADGQPGGEDENADVINGKK
jgi:general secretion pathway protein G